MEGCWGHVGTPLRVQLPNAPQVTPGPQARRTGTPEPGRRPSTHSPRPSVSPFAEPGGSQTLRGVRRPRTNTSGTQVPAGGGSDQDDGRPTQAQRPPSGRRTRRPPPCTPRRSRPRGGSGLSPPGWAESGRPPRRAGRTGRPTSEPGSFCSLPVGATGTGGETSGPGPVRAGEPEPEELGVSGNRAQGFLRLAAHHRGVPGELLPMRQGPFQRHQQREALPSALPSSRHLRSILLTRVEFTPRL